MRKKILSILLCFALLASVAACTTTGSAVPEHSSDSQQLMILRTDLKLSQEDIASQIKAEYLLQNNGYKDDDVVVAIIKLPGNALIDTYLAGSKYPTVADYVASPEGQAQAAKLAANQDALIDELTDKGMIEEVLYRYDTLTNAIAVETTYGDFKNMNKVSRASAAYLSDTYNRPQETSGSTDASGVVNLVDIYETGIFNSSSVPYTGKGTSVAILDSGFDCSHAVFSTQPDVSDDQLAVTRETISTVLGNTNAAKTTEGLQVNDVYYSKKIPYAYDYADKDYDVFPYDSDHGTHVSGIIGGSTPEWAQTADEKGIVGVAVDTQLVFMKVFPDLTEGGETDDIIAAVEDAVVLGVDAINMSLGSSCGFAREEDGSYINDIYDKVNEAGVSLIVAASNDYSSAQGGEQGNTNMTTNPDSATVGSPSTYNAALSVASISGTKSRYFVANGSDVVFYTESSATAAKKNDFFEDLYTLMGWDMNDNSPHTLEYVTVPGVGLRVNYSNIDVKGKVALVRRGDNTFEDKALQAKNAGAIACIIYNNVEGDISMTIGKTDNIPTISISKANGSALAKRSSGTLVISSDNQAGPFMSDFSSWGPNPDLELKPEITAHGGNIKSSIPGGAYDEISGTSMACPNLCGITVLIRQYVKENFPDLNAVEVKTMTNRLLMSTATIALDEEGIPYSPRKQGAGLASLKKVVSTGAYVSVDGSDKAKLDLKDDPERTGVYEMNFNIVNFSDREITYDFSILGMTESISTSDERFVAETGYILGGTTTVTSAVSGAVNGMTVTVPAGQTVPVTATYTLTQADKDYFTRYFTYGYYVEGFVQLDAQGEEETDLNVPFLAYYGDWTEAPMFDATYYEVDRDKNDASLNEEDKLKADYYATTPYGSYMHNYIIPLGTYLYTIDTNSYDPIPANMDHIALSDSFGTIDGLSTIYAGLLRNAKTMDFTITDKVTGEVIWSKTEYNGRKAHSQGGAPIPYFNQLKLKSSELGLVNNRVYEFKMVGKLDYGDGGATTNARNTFTFDFTFDNEAPVLRDCVYEREWDRTQEKYRYYITLTIYDNHYVQSVTPIMFISNSSYTTLSDTPIPVYSSKNTDNTVRFEITDYLEDVGYDAMLSGGLAFSIDDYALNSNIYVCQLPGSNGDLKFTSDGTMEGNPINVVTVYEDEVVDLTELLASSDEKLDPDKDYLKYLTWESSNPEIAEVKEGLVRGIAPGRTTVTVLRRGIISGEMLPTRQATIVINVRSRSSMPNTAAAADTVTNGMAKNKQTILAAKAETLAATSAPRAGDGVSDVNDSTVKALRFAYFDTIFAYDNAAGTSDIGKTGSRIFVSSAGGSVSMYPGEIIDLECDLDPWYVADKYTISFSSTNPTVATVDQNGRVTAVKEGSTTIVASLPGSNIMARIRIAVQDPFIVENYELVSYKGVPENGVVEIPEDEGVLYIGAYAFCLYTTDRDIEVNEDDWDKNKIPGTNNTIEKIIIPDTVEEIKKYAFYNCTELKEVEIKGEVRYLREYAFYNDSKLERVNLENVEAIGARAFYGCTSLKEVNLDKCYSIGVSAFEGCTGLSSVDLTALRNAGSYMFRNCVNIKSVVLSADTKLSYGAFIKSGLTSVDLYANLVPEMCFAQCDYLERVTIHNDMMYIDAAAFSQNPKLTTVEFNADIDLIGERAFYDCNALQQITLPDGNVTLARQAFADCAALTTVNIPANCVIDAIEGAVFAGSAVTTFEVNSANGNLAAAQDKAVLTNGDGTSILAVAPAAVNGEFTVDARVENIYAGAFGGSGVTVVIIKNPDITIGRYAFEDCDSLEKVVFPAEAGQSVIGDYAFYYCQSLTEAENLSSVAEIGSYAFAYSAIAEAEIGANAAVGDYAFISSRIKNVIIGAGANIGYGAFQSCNNLTTVAMPAEGGVHFGPYSFSNAASLQDIDLTKTDGIIEAGVFYGCTALRKVNLAGVRVIGDLAFADCALLSEVVVPDVEEIGARAFAKYDQNLGSAPSFTQITLPETLVKLGEGAFERQTALTSITLPSSLSPANIGTGVFYMATGLKSVTLPQNMHTIRANMFYGCAMLSSVNLENVAVIEDNAFYKCFSLTSVNLSSAETIGNSAFAYVPLAGDINAENLVKVGDYAFESDQEISASAITSFTAPKLQEIGEGAFTGVKTLTEFVFSGDLKKVGAQAFYDCTGITSYYFTDAEGHKVATGEINGYAYLDDGSLYVVLPNGKYMLESVPAGKTGTLTVMEKTVKIDKYAGSKNANITEIVLPMTLKSVGISAFYGYTSLQQVEFRSVNAPALEFEKVENVRLVAGDPGYAKLYGEYQLFGLDLTYYNFIDLLGKKAPIKMVLPSNSDISGYDSLIYEVYFGELSDAERSDFVAMENNMALFIEYAEQIMKIEQLTLADEDLVQNAVTAYNAIKTDYKDFGYSDDEWNAMVTAAQQASAYIKELRFSHASYEIKQLQEKINSLAGEYDPAKIPVMEDIQARLRLLTGSEREVLDLTYYNQYVAEYEKHQNDQPVDPDPDNPDNPENPENPGTGNSCGNCSSKVGFESVGLLATALVAAFFVMKRRTK